MVRERTIYNSLNAWLFSLAKAHRGGVCDSLLFGYRYSCAHASVALGGQNFASQSLHAYYTLSKHAIASASSFYDYVVGAASPLRPRKTASINCNGKHLSLTYGRSEDAAPTKPSLLSSICKHAIASASSLCSYVVGAASPLRPQLCCTYYRHKHHSST